MLKDQVIDIYMHCIMQNLKRYTVKFAYTSVSGVKRKLNETFLKLKNNANESTRTESKQLK